MSYNLAELAKEEREKLNLNLAAASVAFKERYNMPVIANRVKAEQAVHLREYFRKRLKLFRKISHTLDQLPYDPRKG
ncbi:DNA polymerase III subunit theta [Arsenophonus endosymbiont of Aleurodicus floccissimus]|uniref:DNA polymerase III subunit theta n=1 Tax=Arsenophonus endosymbiont of Aleurodicus floccissimus TaxID=2152761 RepID=UPI000E6B140A|nr:DNA polymerase III subunit theta [Arsenophonus endosymbiont of Aleurodicus floccissimus]SPP31129.1 DNA polymerase III subunit theta [Arsenophonus endosymbiont of Aleurodicus floccissimus]